MGPSDDPTQRPGSDASVESQPVVVLSRRFPARPSSFPDIEEFVRTSLADAPLSTESQQQVTQSVLDALLAAAGPEGAGIHVAFRIYPESVEIDVLRSADDASDLELPDPDSSFAEWMSAMLERRGLSREAAARELGVSVRTVSRWVSGDTEPRLRDLRRIKSAFGEVPLG